MQPSSSFNLQLIAGIAVLVSFFSASQDIVLDAYRREILSDRELGLGNSIHVNTYRIAGKTVRLTFFNYGRLFTLENGLFNYRILHASRYFYDLILSKNLKFS